jgi:NADPH:quinone reductase-like Zn-dependent oxidoreductase
MKASRIHRYGDPSVLVYEDAPEPQAGDGEVLIRARAAGVNPIDYRTRAGTGIARYWKDVPFPITLGWDVSGTVASCGAGVTSFKPGDEVYALVRFPRPAACYAQYVAVPAEQVAIKPKSVDHVHAAALPLAALTAWQMMFDTAKLQRDQRLLVHAAAGGVGHFAVQLGRWKGAEVIGTASGKNEAFVRDLGVQTFIDYTKTAFDETASHVDVQLDTVGRAVQERCWGVMKKGGWIVSIVPEAGPLSQETAAAHEVHAANVFVRPDGRTLTEIATLVDSGMLRSVIDEVFPLAEAARAHEHVAAGHTRGKIVLTID